VDFVTDPDGKSFGSGVVARGGTLDRGTVATNVAPSRPPAVVRGPARPGADAVTAPENLSRAARLDEPNPCAGFYPRSASADSGQVTLSLVVRPGGRLASAAVVSETPPGEGFGAAARACLADKTFAPALDRAGNAVTAALSLRVRFTR
jgi:outer membrane biosynthesis protein TonB